MKVTKREIINQIAFCQELMDRLYDDCMKNLEYHADNKEYYSIHKGTQLAQDSIRIRRELNKFNKMVTYTSKGEKEI
jgi:hypothetical protein